MDDSEEDYKSFYKVIEVNCKFKHPGNRLPKIPWFLKSCYNEQVSSLLMQTLYDSKFDTVKFQDKATLLLLLHRSEKENQMMRTASLLQENLDIRERLYSLRESDSKSRGRVRFIEGTSEFGEISITLDLGGEVRNLSAGEEFEGYINLKNDVSISVFMAVGEDSVKIDEVSLFFGRALENVYYLSLVDKTYFSFTVDKGDEKYRISLEATLFLSNADKREILIQNVYENEIILKKEEENDDLYENLLKQLGIVVAKSRISSAIVAERERECCGSCILL